MLMMFCHVCVHNTVLLLEWVQIRQVHASDTTYSQPVMSTTHASLAGKTRGTHLSAWQAAQWVAGKV